MPSKIHALCASFLQVPATKSVPSKIHAYYMHLICRSLQQHKIRIQVLEL